MPDDTSVIVVSMLPRGEPYGASSLVALDRESLVMLGSREFPAEEYLEDPELGAPGQIRHARGIATAEDRIFVALFNSVVEYKIEDARGLKLRPERRFTHPRACDLHGLCVGGDVLAAACTGTDSLITWNLTTEAATVIELGASGEDDVRFPDRLAREAGKDDWREVLQVTRHVNGVSLKSDGTPVACSLGEILEVEAGGPASVWKRVGGMMHDGHVSQGGELLLTDAACGVLISLDLGSRQSRCIPIARTEGWFLRGIGLVDGVALVVSSESTPSRQRHPWRDADGVAGAQGARFMVSKVAVASWGHLDDKIISVPEAARGSVAYGLAALAAGL